MDDVMDELVIFDPFGLQRPCVLRVSVAQPREAEF